MSKDRRSKVSGDILDEVLKENGTATNRNGNLKGLQQFQTPHDLARQLVAKLNIHPGQTVYDPQCGHGNLLNCAPYSSTKFGVDLDPATRSGISSIHWRIATGASAKFASVMDEVIDPCWHVDFAVANPPFGLRWGGIDSTEWTLRHCMQHANAGMLIGNAATIERMGLHEWPEVYAYDKVEDVWDNVEVVAGVIYWRNKEPKIATNPHNLAAKWEQAGKIVSEERSNRRWNFWLDAYGRMRTFLSTRLKLTQKITHETAENLLALDGQTPMSLVGDFKARRTMQSMIDAGYYAIEPECEQAIADALEEAHTAECPIMPVTDFELVAYAEANGSLVCDNPETRIKKPQLDEDTKARIEKLEALIKDPTASEGEIENARSSIYRLETAPMDSLFTCGKSYDVDSQTYKFCEKFEREKVHLEESTLRTYTMSHACQLNGRERKVIIRDDFGDYHEFLDRPDPNTANGKQYDHDKGVHQKVHSHPEADLWSIFKRPEVPTVKERFPDQVRYNHEVMDSLEMVGGFEFKPGQREYLSRYAVKDFGLPAAETGVGKTLLAIATIAMKGPKHALIIAPKGTVKEDRDPATGERSVAQWISEINRFAPWADVYTFTNEVELNGHRDDSGELPKGIYISYYECMFGNNALEFAPKTWKNRKLYSMIGKHYEPRMVEQKSPVSGEIKLVDANDGADWLANMGSCGRIFAEHETYQSEAAGIKCLAKPCMAELYGREFDMVVADEAHKACNLTANLTDALIRLQPKYRFAFTATPIPNKASNLFSLLGWLCVPDWYKGGRCNAAFPYRREDMGRFCDNFLSKERDITAEEIALQNEKQRPPAKPSPILSSPARLLKLIKPTLAYVSKPDCDPEYERPEVVDVRVPMGLQQGRLYAHFMERGNILHKNGMTRAGVQIGILRSICAEPFTSRYNGARAAKFKCSPCRHEVKSPFNPKLQTILGLTRDVLEEERQVVIVNSRLDLTDCIAERLEACGVPYSRIDTKSKRHAAEAQDFKAGKTRVMLMGIKCAQAYSFDQCDRLIIGSMEYSYGSFEQAKGRIDRITSRGTKIYCVLVANSIEETVFDSVATKQDSAAICLLGKRVPRSFKPVDMGELLAKSFEAWGDRSKNLIDEEEMHLQWPNLRQSIIDAYNGTAAAEKLLIA